MSADTIVKALLSQWISRLGVPSRITSDRGRQFESSVFAELVSIIGATHLRTTPYHPQSNGIIERWHRTLKAAILCHNPAKWVHHLPTILLGLRAAFKPDINASPAELVYGSTLTVPGEFFHQTTSKNSTSDFVTEFRTSMQKLRSTDTVHHSLPRTFISKNLQATSHVFVRNDAVRPSLTHPYDGPFLVVKKFDKFFTVSIRGRHSNISIDRLKPAFLSNPDLNALPISASQHNTPDIATSLPNSLTNQQVPNQSDLNSNPAVNSPPETLQPQTTSRGRRVTVPIRFR